MNNPSKDPTFTRGGKCAIVVVNQTNTAVGVRNATMEHRGARPNKPWTPDKEYNLYEGAVPTASRWAHVYDRGKAEQGVIYRFEMQFQNRLSSFKLYCDLTGVEGGSVIKPGFALFNLDGKNKWTDITPKVFTGEWGLSVLNPGFFTPVNLSVQYNPGQHGRVGVDPWSHLVCYVNGYVEGGRGDAAAENDAENDYLTLVSPKDISEEIAA